MDQNNSESKKHSKISRYSEILITDHTPDKIQGFLSKTRGRFFIRDESENVSNEEFKFRFEKKELALSSLKAAMESILKEVSQGDDKTNTYHEFQNYLNKLKEEQTESLSGDDIAFNFYTQFGKFEKKLHLTKRLNQAFQNHEKLKEDSADLVLLKFLHSALTKLPFYSGQCVRAIQLHQNEQDIYKKGSIIKWRHFNSSSKGNKPVTPFDKRNTYFYLTSLTGRDISHASSFPEEREVLFPPGSNFRVEEKTVDKDGRTHITMKQVDIVFTDNIVLWVNDQVLNPDRQFLSYLYGQISKYQLWMVEKPNASEAIKFIEENFTEHLSQCKSFQIIMSPKVSNDIVAYVNQTFNGKEKSCYCYCFEEAATAGRNCSAADKGYFTVNSEKNLIEDLLAKFQYKAPLLENGGGLNENDLNCEDFEDHNESDDFGLNYQKSFDEYCHQSLQSGQDLSTQVSSDKFFVQSGNLNSWISSEQSQNLPNKNYYLESTSQFPERTGGV